MSGERSTWGADTVAIGRGKAADPSHADTVALRQGNAAEHPRRNAPRRRAPMPKGSAPVSRRLVVSATGIAAAVLLLLVVVVSGGGSGSGKAPIREAADPAPRVVAKPSPRLPTQLRRRARQVPDPALKRQPKGQLERREREPHKASGSAHEQAAPVAPEASEPEAESAPDYVPPPEAEAPAASGPEPPAPTPPAVEFGL